MTFAKDISRRHFLTAAATASVLASSTAWAQNSPQRVLRVGHQKGWLSILKGRGTLEKRLAPLGVSVTWTEFNAGPVQLEALNVGSIDFGDVGEAPPIFAQAAGAPLVYAGATVPRPKLEAIIVPKGSPIQTVADLKGNVPAMGPRPAEIKSKAAHTSSGMARNALSNQRVGLRSQAGSWVLKRLAGTASARPKTAAIAVPSADMAKVSQAAQATLFTNTGDKSAK